MPELPEVETVLSGITPYVLGNTVERVVVRERRLRWPVPSGLPRLLVHKQFVRLARRAKYLLFHTSSGHTSSGCLLVHLGMSGSLRVHTEPGVIAGRHDHIDIIFSTGHCLRYHDPRKFGSVLWTNSDPYQHRLLRSLGPEPMTDHFNVDHLHTRAQGSRQMIKQFIMNSHVVAGIGNIYANEALFRAGIHPKRRAGNISKKRYLGLVVAIKQVLSEAIAKGGTTLKDFLHSDGEPGYFSQELKVYSRVGKECFNCKTEIREIKLHHRATYYCVKCQT